MPDYKRLADSADVSVEVFIFDPATGVKDNTVVFNTAGLDIKYRREGEANTDMTLVTLAALTTAHTDFGFLLIGNGKYRLDLPDAAVAAGAEGVTIHGSLTDREIVGCYVHLAAEDTPTQTVQMTNAKEQQINDIQSDLGNFLLGFATFGSINDSTPSATEFVVSNDFVNANGHYVSANSPLRVYALTGDEKGKRALITGQTGLTITVGTGFDAAPADGTLIAIMS